MEAVELQIKKKSFSTIQKMLNHAIPYRLLYRFARFTKLRNRIHISNVGEGGEGVKITIFLNIHSYTNLKIYKMVSIRLPFRLQSRKHLENKNGYSARKTITEFSLG